MGADAMARNSERVTRALLGAALNGREHPANPRTPDEIAAEARAAVAAGAQVLHFHAYDDSGAQTLAPEPCGAAVRAVRVACPGVPISLTTSAAIEPDPDLRHELVAGWIEPPDLVTANQGEPGIVALCDLLLDRGVEIEAGLLRAADAEAFVASGLAPRCVRVLVEPLDPDADRAVEHAAEIERIVAEAGIALEQMHHGDGIASWAVNERALRRGHGIRSGLEDTAVLRDGRIAANNAELIRAAAYLLASVDGGR
jgi:uncharacterized protein (DUF849 family)